jgi:hypothetical protein
MGGAQAITVAIPGVILAAREGGGEPGPCRRARGHPTRRPRDEVGATPAVPQPTPTAAPTHAGPAGAGLRRGRSVVRPLIVTISDVNLAAIEGAA